MKKARRQIFIILVILSASACAGTKPGPAAKAPAFPPMPAMPEIGKDLFADGTAEVRLAHATDGDTAAFIVGNETYDTRFLAVNTPETAHPTYGAGPWGFAAKTFTKTALENAKHIVLELDPNSDLFDRYDRLLAWIWVDGELLNYKLVEAGYAWVMYLYGDYKYNDTMLKLENAVRKTKIKIHGEDDLDYDYDKVIHTLSIAEARNTRIGQYVKIKGVVTAKIGANVFIQQGDSGIYCYASNYQWRHFQPGLEIEVTGMVSDYNGLLEISNIESVELVFEEADPPAPIKITLAELSEQYEARLVQIEGFKIGKVGPHSGKGYDVEILQGETKGVVRVDKYLIPYIDESFFIEGTNASLIAPVGQYNKVYQLMIRDEESLTYE